MGRSDAASLGAIPNANGTLARLAYAHVIASGVDPRPFLESANLTVQQIKHVNDRLRVKDQITFLNLAATALRDDLLGFHLAQSVDLRELGFLYYVSASSESLGDALQRLVRYASIANEGVLLKYLTGRNPGIAFRYVGVSRHIDKHQIEFFAAILVRLCRQLTSTRLVPARVRLTHRRDTTCRELIDFFGSSIEFGSPIDEVAFVQSSSNIPVVSADHHLNKLLVEYCEDALKRKNTTRDSLRTAIENAVLPLLPHGKASIEEVARRLGVSQRTLARRLSREKLSFSTILDSLKVALAERYLSDDGLSISQVAWLLGYKELSSFTRAFKRWTRRSPRQARLRRAS